MKKIVALFAFLIVFAGCSNDNKITLNNLADEEIYFNFRAKQYTVPTQETIVITDIPNGTYAYGTTALLPSDATSASFSGNASDGTLTFEKKSTQILMIYGSTLIGGAYNVNLNTTSTISTTTTASITGP
jgi:hypothetical protein